MGNINVQDNKVIVTFSADEAIMQKAYIKLPDARPPEEGMLWRDYIGNMLMRAAVCIMRENISKNPKLSEFLKRGFERTEATGEGEISITFYGS